MVTWHGRERGRGNGREGERSGGGRGERGRGGDLKRAVKRGRRKQWWRENKTIPIGEEEKQKKKKYRQRKKIMKDRKNGSGTKDRIRVKRGREA